MLMVHAIHDKEIHRMAKPLMQHEIKKISRHIPLSTAIWDEIEDRMRQSRRSYGAEISCMIEQLVQLEKLNGKSQGGR